MNIRKIVRSRVISKEKLPSWYKERMEECNKCEYSFYKKKKRTFKNWWMYILGGFNSTCTICNCPTKYKAAIKEEFCSMEAIGEKPKWDIEE